MYRFVIVLKWIVIVDRKKVEFFAKKDISNYGPLSWQNMVFFSCGDLLSAGGNFPTDYYF
jgi:hypothetical protein